MFSRLLPPALLLAALCANPAAAQQAEAPADAAVQTGAETLSVDAIDARISGLEADAGLEPALRDAVLTRWRSARELLVQARRDEAAAARYRDRRDAVGDETARLNAELDTPPPPPAAIDDELDEAKLGERLDEADALADELRVQLDTLDRELDALRERPAAARRALDAVRAELAALAPPPAAVGAEPSPLIDAQQAEYAARRAALQRRALLLEQELRSLPALTDNLQARHALAERALAAAEENRLALSQALNERRRQIAAALRQGDATGARTATGPAPIRALGAKLAELGREYTELTDATAAAAAQQAELAATLRRLENRYDSVDQQLAIAGLSDALGPLLRRERLELPELRRQRAALRERATALTDARLRRFQLDEARREPAVLDADALFGDLAQRPDDPSGEAARAAALAELRALDDQRRALQTRLVDAYASYIEQLQTLDTTQRRLLDSVERYRRLLDENLFWIASVEPVDWAWLARLRDALLQLLRPSRWIEAGGDLLVAAGDWRGPIALALLVWLALTLGNRRLRRRLKSMTQDIGKVNRDRFALTAEALLISALLALPTALLLTISGALLATAPTASAFARAVGYGLLGAGFFALTVRFVQQLCRGGGLAEAHFGWAAQTCRVFRLNLWWFLMIGLPASAAVAMTEQLSDPLYRDTLGRLAFAALALALTLLLARVLHPGNGAPAAYLAARPHSWVARLRQLWYPLLVAVPVSGAGFAMFGYYYTALQLLSRFFISGCLLLAIIIVGALVLRWLRIEQRRLAWARVRSRREAALAARAKLREVGGVAGDEAPPIETEALDLETISEQSRGLLKLTGFGVAGVGLWLIWADQLPALTVFQNVTLWHQSITTDAGVEVTAITLGNLILALALLVLTLFIARNLPGLLEVAVLQRFDVDAGNRYALTTIIGYLLTFVGLVIALNTIGVSWQKAQWLVAALGVGLGFGLQEIFANFVSGLIILLERPIRVGDTVTLDSYSGTVTRIRIRATTIVDWDRKEIVIPNKTFITSSFTNWTLTDPITRLIVPVGVAYDADVDRVHAILLEAAESHPLVLKEPAPAVLLLAFGDSALQFEVRVFAKQLIDRLILTHELHQRILAALRREGIEIPFPQRVVYMAAKDAADRDA